uniref:Uncharacterized protein n=1 Tax=Clytia hemisphaerica TaxID=252671 RepID=A0A7M5XLF7_9CNID
MVYSCGYMSLDMSGIQNWDMHHFCCIKVTTIDPCFGNQKRNIRFRIKKISFFNLEFTKIPLWCKQTSNFQKLHLKMKKDWTLTPITGNLASKSKQVTFSKENDTAYIYPWSPTKYLLYGKYTEEELMEKRKKRKTEQSEQNVVSILKRPKNTDEDSSSNATTSGVRLLEEIVMEEANPKHPKLPSMAVFSPNRHKDLLTNIPKDNNTRSRAKSKSKKRNIKGLDSSFTLIGQTISRTENDGLPQLPSPKKLNESVFGCLRNIEGVVTSKHNKTPHDVSYKMPPISQVPRKPLIKTQINKIYTMDTTSNLENLNYLAEEEFEIPFPLISADRSKRTLIHQRQEKQGVLRRR